MSTLPCPSPRGPVRKVLSVAVQYSNLRDPFRMDLPGTHKDPLLLCDLLTKFYGYKREDITILMDDERGEYVWPTRENIEKAMRELVADARPGDHFVFHFSGHGGQVTNLNGTEKDGFDEVIFPVDVDYRGERDFDNYIMDDEIHQVLIDHIPDGAHFIMIFDCCHSGTMADLPYSSEDLADQLTPTPTLESPNTSLGPRNIRVRDSQQTDKSPTKIVPQSLCAHHFNNVESWSACGDSERAFGDNDGGLFMRAFTNALEAHHGVTHEELLGLITQEMLHIVCEKRLKNHKPPPKKYKWRQTPEFDCDIPIAEIRYIPVGF